MQQNIQQVAVQLVQGMKRKGTQTQTIKIGNQIFKIKVQTQPIQTQQPQHSISLSDIDPNESNSQSFSKDSLLKQETSKKISLFYNTQEESQPPNSFMNGLLFDEQLDDLDDPDEIEEQKSHGDITEHFNYLLNSNPESKMHFESILQKLQELENEKNQLKKKEEELSHILSTSLNGSQNIFQTSSHLFSLEKIASDPLCRLVSTHFKNLQESTMIETTEKPSILFLYSQPLVYYVNGVEKPFPMLIDYEKQENNIRNVLSECKVGYIRENASIEKLVNWLQIGVEFIHFSGHGVKVKEENEKSDYLIFEDSDGGSYNLSTKELKELLKKMKKSLKFVFVASCHSKQIGEVFLSAGVQHVICIKRQEKILDEACQQFVRNFYISLINNNQSVCQAFNFAKLQVSYLGFPKGEEHKFVILTSRMDTDSHVCNHYLVPKYGEFKDLTHTPKYSLNIPCKVQNFIVRSKIMADVISALSKNRFITLKGIPGIGKSTLGREIVRYINFRNKFKDGVIYVQLLGCNNIEGFFHHLYGIFQGNTLKYKTNHKENIERIVSEFKNKKALIYIDNCDTLFSSDHRILFKTTIESILQNCPHIHFLFTSRNRLGEILNSYELDFCAEKVITVDKLDLEDSKRLFLSKVPNLQEVTEDKINEFIKIAKVGDLANHPLFEFLNGHPQAICMSAALLDGRSLKQLYQILVNRNYSDVFSNDDKKGYNAFRISLQVSWNIIQKQAMQSGNEIEKQAVQMFKIMGMLPSGLDKDTMPKIFGNKWRQSVKVLEKHSLLKETDKLGYKYFSIYPHMIVFAENKLDKETKKIYHEKICEELQRRLFQKIYKNVGTGSALSQQAAQLFFYQQNNYKACIFREYQKIGYSQKLKQFYSNLLNQQTEESDQSQTNSIASSKSSKSKFKIDLRIKNYSEDSNSSIDKKPIRYHQTSSKSKSPFKDSEILTKGNLNTSSIMLKRRNPPAILRLILFKATVLFVLKNFPACEKIVNYGRDLAERMKSTLAQANLIRILACIHLYKHNEIKARDQFGKALELFANIGCGLGVASCQAALGYIQHIEQEYAQAKKNLENALKYYDQIPHIFGKHYLNRWLLNIKTKINRGQNQLKTHNQQALKLLKETKLALKGNKIDSFQLKHKAGFFVFRFMFDNISLFLESAFEVDVRPTKRTTNNSKNEVGALLFKSILPTEPMRKLILENDLLPVVEVKEDERSFIESEKNMKVIHRQTDKEKEKDKEREKQKDKDKDRQKQRRDEQARDLQRKKMMKPTLMMKQSLKQSKQFSSKQFFNRVRTESQHAVKKDWK